ncbi:hypothetical protein SRHO_G00259470 [Serrasalmus rhombeus]
MSSVCSVACMCPVVAQVVMFYKNKRMHTYLKGTRFLFDFKASVPRPAPEDLLSCTIKRAVQLQISDHALWGLPVA